jgi:TPR repeat protein
MAMPFEDGMAAYQRGDYVHAMHLWRPLADQGNARAQSNLGVMYAKGQGVRRRDYAAAASWYRKAAEQGNAIGQSNLGVMYAEGRGVPQDDSVAVCWYRKAAEQGNARAQYNLGVMYVEGRGVPQDHAAAASWYEKAAEQGVNGAEKNARQARHRAQPREQERLRRRKDEQQETWRRGERPHERKVKSDDVEAKDWWVVLGAPEATLEAAKRAYRSKMKQYHPDRMAGLEPELIQFAEHKSTELNAAMEQAKRYYRHKAQSPSEAGPIDSNLAMSFFRRTFVAHRADPIRAAGAGMN